MRTLELAPPVATRGRSVHPNGRPVAPIVWGLYLLPFIGVVIAVIDTRLGFRLFMGSLALTSLVLVLALHVWTRALLDGVVRIATSGSLRFLPPPSLRVMSACVSVSMLIPAAVSLIVSLLGLPTMHGSTRFTTAAPYVLAAVGAVTLLRMLWSFRSPAGLTLTARGLRGVRGSAVVDLDWESVSQAAALGPHGPKLSILTRDGGAIGIDAHQIGSDPAIVAAVIEHYRQHPAERERLANGCDALHYR